MFKDPFDPKTLLGRGCPCGGSHTEADHARRTATAAPAGEEDGSLMPPYCARCSPSTSRAGSF
jgi:hypothetical protein